MPTQYPDVDQLRRQAKRLLRQANDGDPQALRLFARSDRPLRLADAHYAVAKVVGFSSWPALIGAVESTGAATAVERTTRLVLVRGCSGDAEGRFFEHQGPGLNEDGRRQARAAANRLADLVDPALLDPVMSSHRPRSIETAREIAAALDVPFGGPTCDLCQMHPGDAEGLTQQQMIERFGGNYAFVPGAESWPEFIPRATAALMSVVEQHGGRTVIAVTESAVIKASFVAFGGMPVGGAATITTSEGSLTEWSCLVEGDIRRMGTWRLERCNDTPLE